MAGIQGMTLPSVRRTITFFRVQLSVSTLNLSVIECFETDGGVNYRSDRLILF